MTDDPVCESATKFPPVVKLDFLPSIIWCGEVSLFSHSGYFNLVQDLCRLLPLETNHKADGSPAE